MTRLIPALALVVGGLLFGCGGVPEESDSAQGVEVQDAQGSETAGTVTASAVTSSSVYGASVTFNSNGDNFTVNDTAADSHSAVAQIYNYNTGNTSYCWNTSGAGTSVTCNRDFAEGIRIRFRACTGESGSGNLVNCAAWVTVSTAN
ncbi:hypothetical protein [Corallococcus caeni]